MSSPGAGKTVLLEQTLAALRDKFKIAVIKGNMTTELDADRLRQYDVPVIPINTGRSCHLDSKMVAGGIHLLDRIAANVRQMNPNIKIIYLSAKTGEGLEPWFDWISDLVKQNAVNQLARQI